MKKIKSYFEKHKKFKKILKLFAVIFMAISVLFNAFIIGSVIAENIKSHNESNNKQPLNTLVTTPISHSKPINKAYNFDSTKDYYHISMVSNPYFTEYMLSLYDNGTLYINQNIDAIQILRPGYLNAQFDITNYSSPYIYGTGNDNTDFRYLSIKLNSSNTGPRLILGYNGSFIYSQSSSVGFLMGAFTYLAVSKTSSNIGVYLKNAQEYVYSHDPSYLAGYNNGFNAGYESGYADGLQAGASSGGVVDTEITITSNYDFRRLITNTVDNNFGYFQVSSISNPNTLDTYQYAFSGGSNWEIGNKEYNAIVITVQCLDGSQYIKGKDGTYDYVSNIVGDSGLNIYGLIRVDYIYQPNGVVTPSTWVKMSTYNYLTSNDTTVSMQVINCYENGFTGYSGNNMPSLFTSYYNMKWLDNGFRHLINFTSDNTMAITPLYKTLTMAQLLSLNDEAITNNDGAMASVFSLISQAFNSIGGFLSIKVLPNISLGTLLFLPLVMSVIFFIIKLLRK